METVDLNLPVEDDQGVGLVKKDTIDMVERDEEVFMEPSLENATFNGTKAFWVRDYVHGGENGNLKREMIKTGRSWYAINWSKFFLLKYGLDRIDNKIVLRYF